MSENAKSLAEQAVSSADIRRVCGDIPDWKIAGIAALEPTQTEIEVAVAWADCNDEARDGRALKGKAAEVFDILMAGAEMDDDR